jgi:class 3 adenylate cyclase
MRGVYFSIGRDSDNSLCLSDDEAVSRHHCAIEVVGSALVVKDLGSANGTYVNGHRVRSMEPIALPASLMAGHTRLAVMPAEPPPAEDDFESLIQSTYCSRGSIVIPARSKFLQRVEAFLVVDIVGSTRLVQDSDVKLPQIVAALGRLIERALRAEEEPFLKCTGDGFLACFGSARPALDAALQLRSATLMPASVNVQLSTALHWGTANLATGGDRIGKDVHAAFALEELRHEDAGLRGLLDQGRERHLILLTGQFLARLDAAQQQCAKRWGTHALKGLDAPQDIYRWVDA